MLLQFTWGSPQAEDDQSAMTGHMFESTPPKFLIKQPKDHLLPQLIALTSRRLEPNLETLNPGPQVANALPRPAVIWGSSNTVSVHRSRCEDGAQPQLDVTTTFC